MEILAMLLAVVGAYYIGTIVGGVLTRIDIAKEQNSKTVKIYIEVVNGAWYAYDETRKFLAQGTSYATLQAALLRRDPDITYIMNTEALHNLLAEYGTE